MKSKSSKQHASKCSPKKRRAVIRVESEETQDCVLERRSYGDVSQEEVEEVGFVPSALSEPRGVVHWCDNQCSEDGFRFNQIGAMVREQSICASGATRKGSFGKANSR